MPQHRAVQWLSTYGQRYPMAWDLFANFQHLRLMKRQAGPKVPGFESVHDWPDWCWAPIAAAHAVVTLQNRPEEAKQKLKGIPSADKVPAELLAPTQDTGALAAVAAWRATQGIYRFDPDVIRELYKTPVKGDIPADVLRRLPAWCVYIEAPSDLLGAPGSLRGFFAYLEFDAIDSHEELRFALDIEDYEQLVPMMVRLGGSLEEGVRAAHERMRELSEQHWRPKFPDLWKARDFIEGLTSIVLFLCADETDVPPAAERPDRIAKTSKGRQILPTGRPTVIDCGVKLGAALRKSREPRAAPSEGEETGRTVGGHIRAPHWHTFLAGPRNEERRRIVKWLPPIRVALDDDELPDPTLHPVRD